MTTALMVPFGFWFWATWQEAQPPASGVIRPAPAAPVADGGPGTDDENAAPASEPTDGDATELPPCRVGDEPALGDPIDEWQTVVIDTERGLGADFRPPDLVSVEEAGFEIDEDLAVRRFVIDDLTALREAAAANGTPFIVVSAFRSNEHQQRLYETGVEEHGTDQVVTRIARPGHSEHQLGTVIDVLNPEATELDEAFATTPSGEWLGANAHEFGFVRSYPEGGEDRTCYDYEPWHLRYVGRDLAAQIHESGLTPREWMLTQGAAPADDGEPSEGDGETGEEGAGEAGDQAETTGDADTGQDDTDQSGGDDGGAAGE